MRNKIKQLMKKEEGFTLVELLAVIVILGIILAIAVPRIGGIIEGARTDAVTASENLALEAGKLYFIQNPGDSDVPADQEITIQGLITAEYLEETDLEGLVKTQIIIHAGDGVVSFKGS